MPSSPGARGSARRACRAAESSPRCARWVARAARESLLRLGGGCRGATRRVGTHFNCRQGALQSLSQLAAHAGWRSAKEGAGLRKDCNGIVLVKGCGAAQSADDWLLLSPLLPLPLLLLELELEEVELEPASVQLAGLAADWAQLVQRLPGRGRRPHATPGKHVANILGPMRPGRGRETSSFLRERRE